MIFFKKFLGLTCLLFIFLNPLYAEEKTAFIDIDYVVKNSNIGKRMLENIDNTNKKNINLLEKRNNDLKKLETEIKSKKNIISEQDFDKEVKNFQTKIQSYNNEKNDIVNKFNNFRKEELEKVLNSINPIISEYMKQNSINILFDSKYVFMGNPNANLTKIILKKINDELK